MRDNFPPKSQEIIKKRAAYICSNPDCRRMTMAPSEADSDAVQYVGVCAHIAAASPGGARYDVNMTPDERASSDNGIFLCASCATIVDKNQGLDYPTATLKLWKQEHEHWILSNLNKPFKVSEAHVNITSNNQHGGIIANVVNLNGADFQQHSVLSSTAIEHDKKIFAGAENLLDEDTLKYILSTLMYDESIKINNSEKLDDLKGYYSKVSNQFIDETLERAKQDLLVAVSGLTEFLVNEFDMYPYEQTSENFRICMRPEVNIDRAGRYSEENFREHMRLKSILREKCDQAQNAYNSFRRRIKVVLHV